VRVARNLSNPLVESGSGFWIAPALVLTCAHVVPAGPGVTVEVGWDEHVLAGMVTDQLPAAGGVGLWPFPDLAIVQVSDSPDHPCVWLSEHVPTDGAALAAFGHSGAMGEGLQQARIDGRLSGWHSFGEGRFWQFKGNELVAGMSGGPVLDLAAGVVCGLVTMTIEQGADRGGYLVPLDGLRRLPAARWQEVLVAHDRFHAGDTGWTELRSALTRPGPAPPSPVTPRDEVEILGLLAELPLPDEVGLLSLFVSSSPDGRPPGRPLWALRDVASVLIDSIGPAADSTIPLLRMMHNLVGAVPGTNAERGLYDWATSLSGRVGLSRVLKTWRSDSGAAPPVTGGVIVVQVIPGTAEIDRYRLTVSVHRDAGPSHRLYCDETPRHTLDAVKEVACQQLRAALCWLEGNAQIEFVVPIELFDEPFEELAPTKPYTNLGRKYRLVLRDYDRLYDPIVRYDWQRRWQRLGEAEGEIRWITCNEDLTPEQFSAELEQHPETTLVGLSRRPSCTGHAGEMLRVALDSGVPAALWRRDTCPEHDNGTNTNHCSGRRFRSAFTATFGTTPTADLPETVRLLRNRAAGQSSSQADHDCRGIVLLWDDPGSSSAPPVKEPPLRPMEKT
jgi:hypothetical protein